MEHVKSQNGDEGLKIVTYYNSTSVISKYNPNDTKLGINGAKGYLLVVDVNALVA